MDHTTGSDYFTRSVCIRFEDKFYIHNHIFSSPCGVGIDSFYYPFAQREADDLIEKIRKKGVIQVTEPLWKMTTQEELFPEQREIIAEEELLHAEYERGYGEYKTHDIHPELISPKE